jgi:hypothetical protein
VLRRAGFDVIYYGTANDRVDTTVVLIRRGEPRLGEWASGALGAGVVRGGADSTRRLDLTVMLGPDWRPPAGVIP